MDELTIPLGFRFEPTDEELISGFLFEKVIGGSVPWGGVVEKKIYGSEAEPWVVFNDVEDPTASMYWQSNRSGGATKNTRYVFTKLGISKSKKIPRTAGCGGTWSGQTAPKKIKCSQSGATIGVSKMFVYESTKFDVTPKSELGHWIMHEYSLSGLGLEKAGLTACDLVLCKITRSIKTPNVLPRPAHLPLPVPPHAPLNVIREDRVYAYDDVWAAAEASSKKRQRAAEEGWNQESSSSCKKHKAEGEGLGFSDGSGGGVAQDGPGVEAEGDDNIDISWIFDEMEAEELAQGILMATTTGDDHDRNAHDQYAAGDAVHESASMESFHRFLNQPDNLIV